MDAPDARPTAPPPRAEDAPPTHAAFRLVQLLLDPRGLQALMAGGGGLLALGLVLWLVVIGVFDNPVYGALALGVGNFALLGVGVEVARKTRYRLAGVGTTMLACVLLPLNLWFYDAQGLVTIDQGGHLWLPALVCCLVYAGVARLLRDSRFVYTFAAGVAMTGLLFLADNSVDRFWEVLAPSTLLVTLGVAAIHAERLFPAKRDEEDDNPFTREDFGRAFFHAGHALLASGLGVLAAGRLAGRFYEAVFGPMGWFEQPDVATVAAVQLAAIGLTLLSGYAYVYSRLVLDGKRYTIGAGLMAAWSALIGCDLLGIDLEGTLLVVSVAATVATVLGRMTERLTTANAGRLTMTIAAVAGVLLGATRLLAGETDGDLLQLLLGQGAMTAVAIGVTRRDESRGALVGLGGLQVLTTGLVIRALTDLTGLQQFELAATAAGLGMVGAGLIGWRREASRGEDQPLDGVTDTNLWLGSLLATAPLTLGLFAVRLGGGDPWWVATHEIGVLVIGLTLAASGVLCRLRATTLVGVAALAAYVVSLVTLLEFPDRLQNVSVYLMVGGGVVFGAAILLSVYRDRLLAIPERVRNGDGVFAVLKWR